MATSLSEQFRSAELALQQQRDKWDDLERLSYAKRSDAARNTVKSQVSEGGLGTEIWNRTARVNAQLATGKIKSLSRKDEGKNILANMVWTNYVMPNSNAQLPHLQKLRQWDFMSMTYGTAFAMYDYRIDDDYIGPDFWVIPMRDFFPQPGKVSLNDCDWVMVRSWVTPKWLKNKKDLKSWDSKAIDEAIKLAHKRSSDTNSTTANQQERDVFSGSDTKQVELVTKYERGKKGKWCTFVAGDEDIKLRNIDNPHESGRIPVVAKHAFALHDSLIGLGDIERGMSLQKGIDSLINLYLDGVKYSIFPPMKVKTAGVVSSTLKYKPGGFWRIKNTGDMSDIQQMNVSPSGTNTFVPTYQTMRSMLLNQLGSNDFTISSESGNPSFSKTPEGLRQAEARKNTRDEWDREMMEQAISELYEGMLNLMATKQEKPINFMISGEDVQKIVDAGFSDVVELFDSAIAGKEIVTDPETGEPTEQIVIDPEGQAKVTLSKSHLKSEYKYDIDAGTTMQKDDAEQLDRLQNLLLIYTKVPQIKQELQAEGKDFSAAEIIKQIVIKSGIKDWEKILPDLPESASFDQQQGQLPQQGAPQGQPQMDPNMMAQMAQQGAPQQQAPQPGIDPAVMQQLTQLSDQFINGGGI